MKKISIIAALLLVGCNPKLQQPNIVAPQEYLYRNAADSTILSCDNWWEIFRDTTLNRLISIALSQNNDLKAASSRIEEARANRRVVRASFLPSFDFGRSAGVSGSNKGVAQQYIIEPTASWEIPLFGSLKATTISANADIEYAMWQYKGIELSLAAEVATTYFTLLQYQRDLNIAKESSRLRGQTAVLVDSLFVRGMASGANREQAYSLLYTAEADIPLYERAVAQSRLSLNMLLNQQPSDMEYITADNTLSISYIPIGIPAGVPSDLLYRRPDIMSNYAQLVSAAASAKLARAERFPSLNLTGDGGVVSKDISTLFASGSWVWELLLSLSQPIYQFGALKSRERVAVEQYNQSLINYRQSFLEALVEVEKSLVAISTYREQLKRYRALVASNDTINRLTNSLYLNGLSAYLDVIDSERTLYNSQMEYSNLIADQYINYINLCKALGGGW